MITLKSTILFRDLEDQLYTLELKIFEFIITLTTISCLQTEVIRPRITLMPSLAAQAFNTSGSTETTATKEELKLSPNHEYEAVIYRRTGK